jgi:hypothetical protein
MAELRPSDIKDLLLVQRCGLASRKSLPKLRRLLDLGLIGEDVRVWLTPAGVQALREVKKRSR